ncbi:hypothetical protein BDN72DRAFT_850586 [Pluteus cervinus]|uniref:Uncharacterized protein n=1 Tax=Pluteus cervinus TaxID=181527 RepID=A0ACD3A3Q0_9AGAR|nr:hypothetical protein BDN72DRAFT_850586 [Pluteus cervinus]
MSLKGSKTTSRKPTDPTPLILYDPHAQKRFQIDDQILALKQQIQKLQVARNAYLPISSLPNEVLSNIFLICRRKPYSDRPDIRVLLTLTWVCHHWRDVALSDSSLWTYIGGENFLWAAECLSRSKEAPLEVIFDGPCTSDVRTLLLFQLHRFKRLEVDYGSDQNVPGAIDAFSNALKHPAPMLESLSLHHISISTILSSGVSPSLHTLSLYGGFITWAPNILPLSGLKNLSIQSPELQIFAISFVQLLPSSLPRLETLRLDGIFCSSPASTSSHHLSKRVYFPNLRKVRIGGGEVAPVSEFFELFGFSPFTMVDVVIQTYHDDTGRETAVDFLRLLQVSGALGHRPISAWIVHTYETDDSMSFEVLPSSDDEKLLSFHFMHHLRLEGAIQLFASLLAQNLRTLCLAVVDMSMDDWSRVFAQFSNLEELTLADDLTVQSFIEFIGNSTPEDASDDSDISDTDSEILPALPFKALRRVRFLEDSGSELNEDNIAFCEALKVRGKYGLGLEKIWVIRGMFDVNILKEGVEVIVQEKGSF